MEDVILDVQDLKTYFYTDGGVVRAADGLSYQVHRGECVAIIGESGSGKSVSALSVMKLIPDPPGKIVSGRILFKGRDILQMTDGELQSLRGSEIGMIFQEPGAALDPVMTVGKQIAEAILLHKKVSRRQAMAEAVELLGRVGIPNPEQRAKQYPFEFSGGMQQRAMIAMAMSCGPDLLIADEPTTALDVTVQAQVLEELDELRRTTKTALIIITHNLGVVARYADTVKIVYGGSIVESGTTKDVFEDPHHPYTLGLIRAVPRLDRPRSYGLHTIPGEPPDMSKMPENVCVFAARCKYECHDCTERKPPLVEIAPGHMCACLHADATKEEREELLR